MLFRNFELIVQQLQVELKYWVPLLFYTLKLLGSGSVSVSLYKNLRFAKLFLRIEAHVRELVFKGTQATRMTCVQYTAQKMKFSIKDFFSKSDQILSFLRIWSHLLTKSKMENFIFCAAVHEIFSPYENCLQFL